LKSCATLLSALVVLAAALWPGPSLAQAPGTPKTGTAETDTSKKDASKKDDNEAKKKTGAADDQSKKKSTPAIQGITSQTIPLGLPQKLTLNVADFQDGATVVLQAPSGSQTTLAASQFKRIGESQMEVSATFGEEGDWQITIQNPDGGKATTSVRVSAGIPDPNAVAQYKTTSGIITLLLFAAMLAILVSLCISAGFKKWSLGDALSEESGVQPAGVTDKAHVIMVASSSRLIALVGLVGILTTILGIGYAIIWRLFVYGAAPNLGTVQNFLFGSACLFAPYLANQLRGIFSDRAEAAAGAKAAEKPQPAGASSITSVVPVDLAAAPAPRAVSITGSGFQKGVSVTLTAPDDTSQTIVGANVTYSSPALIAVNAALNQVGMWKVAVTNPRAAASNPFQFTVTGPPQIDSFRPQNPGHGAPVNVTFIGDGFLAGASVRFRLPGAGAGGADLEAAATVTKLESDRLVVNVTFPQAGAWLATVSNQGGHAAGDLNITVN
jgi:hypothetical protein